MEQGWQLIGEIEDEAPITEGAALRVRNSAEPECLIGALEDWDGE
jgi:hypothetical protein